MKKWDIKIHFILQILCIIFVSFFIYFFSFESHVKILSCTGNYYLSDQQVFQQADVNMSSRLLFVSESSIQKKLLENPLIESVQVKKEKDKITIDVQEKTIVGYYIKKGKTYFVCTDGSRIELDKKSRKSIVHVPLLTGFKEKQLDQICTEFKQYNQYLTRSVIEKIAEIGPYKISYDQNMLKLTMQDGNVVYSRMSDLMMMSRYEEMLIDLKGNSVCLVLDSDNSVIAKVDCAYMNMNDEDRQKYHEVQEQNRKEYEKQKEIEKREQEQREKEELQAQQEAEQENESHVSYEADDWSPTDTGYLYSKSLNLYKDPSSNTYFVWDSERGFIQKND